MCVCVCVCMRAHMYMHEYTLVSINNDTCNNFFDKKELFFSKAKVLEFLLFLVEHYTMKMDFIMYYLLPNSTALNTFNQKYEHVVFQL